MPPEIATAVPSIPSYILLAFSAGGVKSCRAHKEFVRLAPCKRPLCKGTIFLSGFPLCPPLTDHDQSLGDVSAGDLIEPLPVAPNRTTQFTIDQININHLVES